MRHGRPRRAASQGRTACKSSSSHMDMAAYTPFSLFRVPSGGGDQVKVVDGPERGVIDLAVSRRRKRERERVSISFFLSYKGVSVFWSLLHSMAWVSMHYCTSPYDTSHECAGELLFGCAAACRSVRIPSGSRGKPSLFGIRMGSR